jgi:putative transcriptional regulator
MAKMLGISRTFYWQIENGKRKLKYLMAIQISSIFNLRPDDIFYDEFLNIVDNEK